VVRKKRHHVIGDNFIKMLTDFHNNNCWTV